MSLAADGGRERAFQELRESEELHRVLLSNISDAVFLTDDTGRFTFVCPNVDVIFGVTPDDVNRLPDIGHLLGTDLLARVRRHPTVEVQNVERPVVSHAGLEKTVLVHVKPVSIRNGTLLWVCRDVTDRRRAEEQAALARQELAHASRLSLVGELVASFVHEISQPLTVIQSNADSGRRLIARRPQTQERRALAEILEDVTRGVDRAADVMDRLRALTRKTAFTLEPVDVNDAISDTMHLVAAEARSRRVTLSSDLADALPQIRADRICLRQVLLNLIVNALDAVSDVDPNERRVMVRSRPANGRVEIRVTDTGPGVRQEDRARLFEPFFTTKKNGVGLGLAISRSLIEAQGGELALGEPLHGAEFQVTLPGVADS